MPVERDTAKKADGETKLFGEMKALVLHGESAKD